MIKRYDSPVGYCQECDSGEFVKYEDIAEFIPAINEILENREAARKRGDLL